MGWLRKKPGDAYKPEWAGPVEGLVAPEGLVMTEAEAPARCGRGVIGAGNAGGGQTCLLWRWTVRFVTILLSLGGKGDF